MPEQLTLPVFDTIAVEPTRDVLLRGADAISAGVFLFAHHHVPARPATVTRDRVWLAMLDLAETPAATTKPAVPSSTSPAATAPRPTGRSAPET